MSFGKTFWPEDEKVFRSEERKLKRAEGKSTTLSRVSNKLESGSKWRKTSKVVEKTIESIPCTSCPTTNNPCPPEGVVGKLMFIGINPGKEEGEQGRVFVGNSGKRLRKDLAEVGISVEEDCWLTNLYKCPLVEKGKNRTPTVDEIKVCGKLILKEISEVNPFLIVLLGEPPLKFFFRESIVNKYGFF